MTTSSHDTSLERFAFELHREQIKMHGLFSELMRLVDADARYTIIAAWALTHVEMALPSGRVPCWYLDDCCRAGIVFG